LALLLEGKSVAQAIKDALKDEVAELYKKHGQRPVLASVVVGTNPAAHVYLKSQAKTAQESGIEYRLVSLPTDVPRDDLIAEVVKLNADRGIHGIMVQTPLPKGIGLNEIMSFISARKDAEGMHPENLGKILLGEARVTPCTAQACMELLRFYHVKLYGKEVVVVGHSDIVGKPLALMLLKEFATTTVCHIATSEAHRLTEHVARAEVLIVAVGKTHLIKGSWIKEGAVVIDVGINRIGEAIVGDVEFQEAGKRASFITPVPGGVGPLTVAILMKNCVELFKETVKK
jgi:methylenetetrahydrofolate dehydrogenase (NADP+)/methenyltetrahydrofolate cyclohydrolase